MLRQVCVLGCLVLGIAATADAVPPGTLISNTASATYDLPNGSPGTRDSNPVDIITEIRRTPSEITFLQYAPTNPEGSYTATIPATTYSTTGDLASPAPFGPIDGYNDAYQLPGTIPVVAAQIFHGGQPLIIRLEDKDQNVDNAVAETVYVRITCPDTGDDELLQLTEDGNNSGFFYGYVITASSSDTNRNGILSVIADCSLTASYTDAFDGQDVSVDAALIDPYGFVFDTVTGELLDGARVTLFDVTAGAPAEVFDDFGQPGYPSTVTTGDPDLNFPSGGFRFPLIEPGSEYRLDIIPPAGYGSPSSVQPDILRDQFDQFTIDDLASYGEVFFIKLGPAIKIDIPVDPAPVGLWLQKEALDDVVAVGDFLMYTLTVENLSESVAAYDVVIDDRLPLGFRYQSGSLRVAGREVADPAIARNGRQMQLIVGEVPAAAKVSLNYVVEVGAGAQLGYAVNRAMASDAQATQSNQATARVMVRDDFFRNNAFIMGRVKVGSCEIDDTAKDGLGQTRIYLEDGTYAVTDSNGMYHFEGVTPGVHVVQLDLNTLPAGYESLSCEQNTQFSGRSFSQFVDLQGGTLWVSDFYVAPKPPAVGTVDLSMNSQVDGHLITHSIDIATAAVPADNLRLTVILPQGSTYLPGSAKIDGQPLTDPSVSGPAAVFRLGNLPADKRVNVSFQADSDVDQQVGEKTTKAMVLFDSPASSNQKTPLAETVVRIEEEVITEASKVNLTAHYPTFAAEIQEQDKAEISKLAENLSGQNIISIKVVGHTDNVPIGKHSQHIHADNQALSEARAKRAAEYLSDQLKVSEAVVETAGRSQDEPVADNLTAEGRTNNRRAELQVHSIKEERSASLEPVKTESGRQSVETRGLAPTGSGNAGIPAPPMKPETMPALDKEWLSTAEPGLAWIWPTKGHYPDIGTTKVAIKHDPKQKLQLRKDGQDVHPLTFEGIQVRDDGKVAISLWRGLGLDDGDNQFEVIVQDAAGKPVERISRNIHLSTEPTTIEVVDQYTHLIADGVTKPRLAIRLRDQDGHPVRTGSTGEFQVHPPFYTDRFDTELEREDDSLSSQKPKYFVGRDGIALLTLEPTTTTSEAIFSVKLPESEEELRVWVRPHMRDWILVGFAEGTAGYNTFSGNQVSLDEAGIDEHFYDDGQVKFFAKGAIKGEWLLTMAYDSDKPNRDGDSLYQIIDPDTYYPLYGDGTRQGYEASSAHGIYLKIEREQFYALFGDMSTGLSQTELSRYNRTMSGFKSEMQANNFSYTLFAADTKQAFAKDEIQGDGTSGRYYLSEQDIVINSETVTIETRDRFHSEQIIELQTLARHTDYDIDYDDGSLFFKSPIASKDQSFNPNFIVVRYETLDSADENFNYGGRAAVKLLNKKIEVGATYIHEDKGSGDGDLYGTDVTVELSPQTTLHAEMAATETQNYDLDRDGQSYLAEVRHSSNRITGNTYYREQQGSFGLGQQNDSETSTRKYGVDGSYQLSPQVSVSGQAYHEDNLSTDAKRDVAEFGSRYDRDRFGVHTGLRGARDKFEDGETQQSNQWLIGGNWMTADRKLNLRSDYEQSLGNNNENSDFPTLLTLGADYKLTEKISLFAEQEFSWGDEANTDGTRAGFKSTPWKGGDLRTAVEQQTNENGQRVFAIFGLGQSWQVNERWGFDASLDRGYTIKTPDSERVNNNVPPAHGADDDFTSVSVGSTYRKAKWTWWNRLETRQAQSEDKYGISTSVVGEPKDGVAVSAKALAFISKVSGGARHTDGNIRLGAAYRPSSSRWILLNRLDFYFDKMDDSDSDYDNWRIVNNLHANFRLNRKLQMSFYYGLKYVRDSYNGRSYSGYTDLIAFETRYNINKRWDIGLHGSMLHSWNSNQYDYSLGADVGYSPITNTWVSLGYNLVGFEDEDFSAAHYTAQGAYMRFRAKYDQQSVKDAAKWINR
ncbi:OmpA family protein [Deltaproteobacteria bacterium IMCC39524]|nr:OmpA family protein [Deltaproteobacteria bacterium IMCC39524]